MLSLVYSVSGQKLEDWFPSLWYHTEHFHCPKDPLYRWGNNGNHRDFIFLGSQITADGDCSHEIKRHLLLGRKAMTNLDSTFKSRDITLPTKVHLVKAMVFSAVMYGYESWTIKKAERQRIDVFDKGCSRRLLRIPWLQGDQISQS